MTRVFAVLCGHASHPCTKQRACRISSWRSLLSHGPAIVFISSTVIANSPCHRCHGARAKNSGSNDVSCQHTILASEDESAHAIGRFPEAWIAVTTCLWKRLGTCGRWQSPGLVTAAAAGG